VLIDITSSTGAMSTSRTANHNVSCSTLLTTAYGRNTTNIAVEITFEPLIIHGGLRPVIHPLVQVRRSPSIVRSGT
jgi:hypothetical protein